MNSIWAFITSWVTPTYLFLLLNLTIATIVLSSRFRFQRRPEQQQLDRVPSYLDRVKSINFSLLKFEQPNAEPVADHFLQPTGPEHENTPDLTPDRPPPQIARSPSMLERLKSINLSSLYRSDSSAVESEVHHPTYLNSDAASEKSAAGSSEEKESTPLEEDEEVDVKADDFIESFKQQLRLQRLDSLLRYKYLLKRN